VNAFRVQNRNRYRDWDWDRNRRWSFNTVLLFDSDFDLNGYETHSEMNFDS